MLRVKTTLKCSPIHGFGVFAAEFIPKGTITWVLDEGIDLLIPIAEVENLPPLAQAKLFHYGYILDDSECLTLCADDARFMNHSSDPNTRDRVAGDVAVRDIQIGEELTCDYYEFDKDAYRKLHDLSS